jgi:hypothetical protein
LKCQMPPASEAGGFYFRGDLQDARLWPKADIVQPLNGLCLTHTRPFECASLGGYYALS